MDAFLLNLLRSPGRMLSMQVEGEAMVAEDGQRFRIRDGIPVLLNAPRPSAWQAFYDATAFGYDATLALGARLRLGSEERIREEWLRPRAATASVVLEVGCGTAANRGAFSAEAAYIGMDLSLGMLRRAQRRCARLGTRASFVQADAQELPLVSAAVNLVLAMGVLQHVRQPQRTLAEMARVAATGARVLIVDETRSWTRLARRTAGGSHAPDAFLDWAKAQMGLQANDREAYIEIGEYFCLDLFVESKRHDALLQNC
jgi:ubiquinone/menaquinone biosynthesis C-methylase UbiE